MSGTAQGGRHRFGRRFLLAARARQHGKSKFAIGFGHLQFERIASLGRKRQSERDIALVDQRAIGAVGKQRLNLSQHLLPGNQSGQLVADFLCGGNRAERRVGSDLQAAGNVGGDHGLGDGGFVHA